MTKRLTLFVCIGLLLPSLSLAQQASDKFYLGKILETPNQITEDHQGVKIIYQEVKIKILDGPEKNKELMLKNGGTSFLPDNRVLKKGEKIVLVKGEFMGEIEYQIIDRYRLPSMLFIFAIFFGLVIFLSRWQGLFSMLGLGISLFVLVKIVVPKIIAGGDPLTVGVLGVALIAVFSIYTAHGFKKRTSVAVLSTLITLALSLGIAVLFTTISKLFGTGSEEASYLQLGSDLSLNLKGLFLAGIIIGTLGVLDDVTTSQTAAVEEIKKANNSLGFSELYKRGLSVGKEHISSLVNTLVLAYAGASLPLFLLFYINTGQPLWLTVNGEFIAEEIIRTLVGSTSLVLAVPISTLLAAYFFSKEKKEA